MYKKLPEKFLENFGIYCKIYTMGKIVRLTESELTNVIKEIIKEQEEDRRTKTILQYVNKQFKGMKRESYGWNIGDKHVLQYVNNHFIVREDYREELENVFGLSGSESNSFYKMYLKKRFPRYNMFGIIYTYLD